MVNGRFGFLRVRLVKLDHKVTTVHRVLRVTRAFKVQLETLVLPDLVGHKEKRVLPALQGPQEAKESKVCLET
jgi:hypothetical protein